MKEQIEEISKKPRDYAKFKPFADDLRKAESWCDLDGVLNRYQTVKNLSQMGYRKQSEGEWVKKHRHRGGFRTITVTDSFGKKHTGMVDDRYECDDLYCSVCGKIAHDAFLSYCANCGAKMKGGAE